MKDLLLKLRLLIIKKIGELYLWFTVSGFISWIILKYVKYYYYIDNIYFTIICIIFIFYACYKLIVE